MCLNSKKNIEFIEFVKNNSISDIVDYIKKPCILRNLTVLDLLVDIREVIVYREYSERITELIVDIKEYDIIDTKIDFDSDYGDDPNATITVWGLKLSVAFYEMIDKIKNG